MFTRIVNFGARMFNRLFFESEAHRKLSLPRWTPKGQLHNFKSADFDLLFRNVRADFDVAVQIILGRNYDIAEFKQASAIVDRYQGIVNQNKKPLILDLGANIGIASLWFANSFPQARVVGVEPSMGNYEIAQKNGARSGRNIDVLHAAIANQRGKIDLYDTFAGEWGFSTRREDDAWRVIESVDAITIADVLEKYAADEPFILKMDIEGAEKGLFDDHQLFERFALIVIELHDWMLPWSGTSNSFLKLASNGNFDFVHRGEDVFLFNSRFRK
jgi:FkbM family methyltransferase